MPSFGLTDTDGGAGFLRESGRMAVRADCPPGGCCDDAPCAALYRLAPCSGSSPYACGWPGPPPLKPYICPGKVCANNGVPVAPGAVIKWAAWCWTVTSELVAWEDLPDEAIVVGGQVDCAACGNLECSPDAYFASRQCSGNAGHDTICAFWCAKAIWQWAQDPDNFGLCPTAVVYDRFGNAVCVRPDWDNYSEAEPGPGCTVLYEADISFGSCCQCLNWVNQTQDRGDCWWDSTDRAGNKYVFNKPDGSTETVAFPYLECCCSEHNGVRFESLVAYTAAYSGGGSDGIRETGFGEGFVGSAVEVEFADSFGNTWIDTEIGTCNWGTAATSTTNDFLTHFRPWRGPSTWTGWTVHEWTYTVFMSCGRWGFTQKLDYTDQFGTRWTYEKSATVTRFGGSGRCGEGCGQVPIGRLPPGAGPGPGVGPAPGGRPGGGGKRPGETMKEYIARLTEASDDCGCGGPIAGGSG